MVHMDGLFIHSERVHVTNPPRHHRKLTNESGLLSAKAQLAELSSQRQIDAFSDELNVETLNILKFQGSQQSCLASDASSGRYHPSVEQEGGVL
jgi:hypothetical protein